ncbi:hypothetical protein OUZ56_025939 [Daphnia magna]|uniref:Uncharacterized protein n=1 Tax=Daphnia magna TaxID=35525 RepID=A0ABQ9ZKF0_9CRUS|nr:hypothetical protein OUZ56_025939 [Daphnia magna]
MDKVWRLKLMTRAGDSDPEPMVDSVSATTLDLDKIPTRDAWYSPDCSNSFPSIALWLPLVLRAEQGRVGMQFPCPDDTRMDMQ